MIIPSILSKQKPLFERKLYVTAPTLPTMEELSPKIAQLLESKWVTNFGNYHDALEVGICRELGVDHVALCCNGTMALFLLLKAMELKGEVLTTPFTFPATIHALYLAGLTPRFCDIDPDDYLIDPVSIEENISDEATAIVGVNVFCGICDVDMLDSIATTSGMPVMYDSAHAFLASYRGKPVGGFGKAEMFSFHATKLFTTIEGGAIATNDEALYRKLRYLINFGIKDEEHVVGVGLNAKMSEVNAIFGLLALQKKQYILGRLKRLHALYREKLAGIPGIKFQKIRDGYTPNYQYMTVEILPDEFGLDRNAVHKALRADNVIARKYFFPPAHRYECYRNEDFAENARVPHVDRVAARILCLPMYPSLSDEDAEAVCDLMSAIHRHAGEISGAHQQTERIGDGSSAVGSGWPR